MTARAPSPPLAAALAAFEDADFLFKAAERELQNAVINFRVRAMALERAKSALIAGGDASGGSA